jgi:hypothetical protein
MSFAGGTLAVVMPSQEMCELDFSKRPPD